MKNENFIKIFFFYYLPLLIWMGLIFYLSSLSGDGTKWERDIWFYIERKGAHILEYLVLVILFIRFFTFCKFKCKLKQKEILGLSLLFSLVYAFSDEIHQTFVFGREGKFVDVGIDLIGIILAVVSYGLFFNKDENK